jgi:hypothetical protein
MVILDLSVLETQSIDARGLEAFTAAHFMN